MAAKSVDTTKKRGGARKQAAGSLAPRPRKRAAAAPVQPQPAEAPSGTGGAKALIRAGLKALGDVRGDMVARQTRIFELLLGIGQSPAWTAGAKNAAAAAADPFGKFEDVFDQRVACSLERLGMPSPQALRELTEQMKTLTALLQDIEPRPRKR
jgi:hypothetical protein